MLENPESMNVSLLYIIQMQMTSLLFPALITESGHMQTRIIGILKSVISDDVLCLTNDSSLILFH